ncbi:hypothetical protein ZEAMMB73_Zm00001d044740 [Zea mays]|uniref:DUF7895 domain-containing protein n=1 Tax=Zea mays TaxID=4577 RepID=A0A1D6NR50_MAIZE|nr:hypothetical protein ZEAMMB73_Zm00001d044740 [Zea mays]
MEQQPHMFCSNVGHSGAKVPDCGGTGLCSRCKGECFVFKQLSKETATRSHKAAKNMATGYTSGLSTNGPTATSTPPPACLHKMAGVLPTINTHVKRSWDVHVCGSTTRASVGTLILVWFLHSNSSV